MPTLYPPHIDPYTPQAAQWDRAVEAAISAHRAETEEKRQTQLNAPTAANRRAYQETLNRLLNERRPEMQATIREGYTENISAIESKWTRYQEYLHIRQQEQFERDKRAAIADAQKGSLLGEIIGQIFEGTPPDTGMPSSGGLNIQDTIAPAQRRNNIPQEALGIQSMQPQRDTRPFDYREAPRNVEQRPLLPTPFTELQRQPRRQDPYGNAFSAYR